MSLQLLQHELRDWLRGDDEPAARFGADALPGLRVYRNNYRAHLVDCLEESFPQTRRWLGVEDFGALCITHIQRVPPSAWTLDAYPRDFPETVGREVPSRPECAELAWLELALGETFVAADAVPIALAALGAIDWERATLSFVPSIAVAAATTNAGAIWAALAADAPPPAPASLPEAGSYLVWRAGEMPCFRTLDAREARALAAMRAGMAFGRLCGSLAAAAGDEAAIAAAGGLLGRWIADGLVAAVGE